MREAERFPESRKKNTTGCLGSSMVEQLTLNQLVRGSSPRRGTIPPLNEWLSEMRGHLFTRSKGKPRTPLV